MILNYSKTIRSVISLLCSRYHREEDSRDITLIIVLQWNLDYSNYLGGKGVHIIEKYVKSNIHTFIVIVIIIVNIQSFAPLL